MVTWLNFAMSSRLPIRGNRRGPGGKQYFRFDQRLTAKRYITLEIATRINASQYMSVVLFQLKLKDFQNFQSQSGRREV